MHEWEDAIIFFVSIEESPSDPLWSEFPYAVSVDALWLQFMQERGGATSD
jgi:hypothetical protein